MRMGKVVRIVTVIVLVLIRLKDGIASPTTTNNDHQDVIQDTTNSQTHNHGGPTSIHHIDWTRQEIMDGNGLYILEWWIKSKEIVFRITANTRGFIGLGFTQRHETMEKADLVLAWVDDRSGKPNVLDCHGPLNGNGAPIQDDTQNYIIEQGMQNNTHTQIQFRRSLETCDPNDITITSDTMKVLWSFGDTDPIHGNLKGHGSNRGAKPLHLLNPLFRKPTHNRDIKQWDVTVKNISIASDMDTLYWCKILKAPTLPDKHHIIGYEALLTKESTTKRPIVHHMTLFECSADRYPGSDPNAWDVWVKSNGAECYSNLLTPRDWESCTQAVAVWAVGSTGQFLPKHVGIPMGGNGGPKYYMLEIHYDNPKSKKVLDQSGFRIHYSHHLRKHEAGMLVSGVTISDTLMIPPNQKLYRNIGICGPSCTGTIFPENGIKIVSAALHSHNAGRRMKLRHIRNGKELDRIITDDNFDVNYQQVRQLENETIVLPGDYLITDCAFETIGRKRPTFGGYNTNQEMCLSFIMYYPRIDITGCYSMTPVKEFFETFGVNEFYGMNMTDVENMFLYNGNALDLLPTTMLASNDVGGEGQKHSIGKSVDGQSQYSVEDVIFENSILNKLIISDPVEFHDRSFMSHLNQLPWSEPLFTRRVEQSLLMGKHMTFCRVSNDTISIPSEIIRYPNFTNWVKPASHCPFNMLMDVTISASFSITNSLQIVISLSVLYYGCLRIMML